MSDEKEVCPRCNGSGKVAKGNRAAAWGTTEQRAELARKVGIGDRWIQIKSGRIAVVIQPLDSHGCIGLKHENGRSTYKWRSYFASEFTPETPPA